MAMVKVKAVRMGYYNHKRQREDSVFFIDEKDLKKDGKKNVLPSWVVELGPKAKSSPEPIEEQNIVENDEVI